MVSGSTFEPEAGTSRSRRECSSISSPRRNDQEATMATIVDDILAIREQWHTKRHPFFRALADGKLPLRALGIYLAMHWQFVQRALASFGILFTRTFTHEDIRRSIVENLAEEEGLKAIPREGHVAHDHSELILRFCRAAGLSEAEVRRMKMTPAWWGRS